MLFVLRFINSRLTINEKNKRLWMAVNCNIRNLKEGVEDVNLLILKCLRSFS